MIFTRRPRSRAETPQQPREPHPIRRMFGRICDVSLVLGTTAVVVYVGFITYKVFGGYTAEEPTPVHNVRLQIVDASPTGILLAKLAPDIEAVSDMDLEVVVAETSRFKVRPTAESFVISRKEDLTAARLLAERLGLDPDQVEYKPLEDNRGLITATLVVGADGVRPTAVSKKET